jgi:ATP-dependent Clp protease ATP-binding subunit ClpA
MKLTIPLYVWQHRGRYTVRPLFFVEPVESDEKLDHAQQRLTRKLREQLHRLGEALRHDELARRGFCPALEYHRSEVPVELRRRVARVRFLLVCFRALGRRVAFTPTLPEVWFELDKPDQLVDRAGEVLSEYFRRRENEDEEDFVPPEKYALSGTAWVSNLEIDIVPSQITADDADKNRLFLGASGTVSGEEELFRVGRCLDHLYPEDLDRVVLRDRELAELTRTLDASDRRPVLLVGPSLVGKTALLHEYVYRAVEQRSEKHRLENLTWLLAPQRLISGMSYVGQWEHRLLAILKEAAKRNHLLYFDNVIGLYHAGLTSQSDLSVAHVLKPYVERREVRMIAEMTPEALRVFRERDRGFADLFHIVPIAPSVEADTLRILIASQRQLEARHRCRFDIDVLPAVLDLQRRYARHQAFPGKAAVFLRRLGVKYPGDAIGRYQVFVEFHARSGLRIAFLDPCTKLERDTILDALREQIIGQDSALNAAADVVSIARARLNEPDRPLAALLFLGPTGVGKTQTAKALARYLFGDVDKLLRFDMNEFFTPGSAARLVGTFFQPEGLLTAAVRRQPFSVVLLDEIEKAHPEVFDLLLQVLGEGRLTDAHGRLTDFSNTIVILTSNLGVREAEAQLGFRSDADDTAYARAAERFFRPEFFNRLDRVVPFERLSRGDVWHIAELLMRNVLEREGLVRRKCVLRVETAALERVVDAGYDAQLGARALKRAIERLLTQPVARRLAEGLPDTMTLIHLFAAGEGVSVHVEGLTQVEPAPEPPDLSNRPVIITAVRAIVARAVAQIEPLRPTGAITAETAGRYAHYFQVKELAAWLSIQAYAHEEQLQTQRTVTAHAVPAPMRGLKSLLGVPSVDGHHVRRILKELAAAQDVQLYLDQLVEIASADGQGQYRASEQDDWDNPKGTLAPLADVVHRAVLLHTMIESLAHNLPPQALLLARVDNASASRWLKTLPFFVAGRWAPGVDMEGNPFKVDTDLERAVIIRGLPAVAIARWQVGTHVIFPRQGGLIPIEVCAWPIPDGMEAADVYRREQERRQEMFAKRGSAGRAGSDASMSLPPVLRLYHEDGKTVDLRSGLVSPRRLALADLVLAGLPLPPEFQCTAVTPERGHTERSK